MNKLALALLLTCATCAVSPAFAAPGDAGVPTVPAFIDAGATVALPATAEQLPNPAEHPVQAWSDEKLAKKTSWPLAIWAALAMLGKALAYGREKLKNAPLIGKAAAWLADGKRVMVVAGIGAIGAAGYNVLASGGTLVAALVASGVALAGVTHSTTQPSSSGSVGGGGGSGGTVIVTSKPA